MKKHYYICCSDSGASNLIYHWYIANKKKYIFSFCLNSFAKKIFKKKNKKLNSKIDCIITGTGKIKHKYIEAIKYGKKNNIKTISFLDHYVNYNSRFVYKKISILPDEIWAFDKMSFLLAKNFYKNATICNKKNYYLDFLKKNFKIYLKKKNIKKNLNILFLSEPDLVKKRLKNKIIQNILIFLNQYDENMKIVFRLHPSEKKSDLLKSLYNLLINKKNITIAIDTNLSIANSLYQADIVIGGATYAMVLALKLNFIPC